MLTSVPRKHRAGEREVNDSKRRLDPNARGPQVAPMRSYRHAALRRVTMFDSWKVGEP